ncbi:MAG: hypothetical protein ACE5F1_15090 [Planctomycetota bacterium]
MNNHDLDRGDPLGIDNGGRLDEVCMEVPTALECRAAELAGIVVR